MWARGGGYVSLLATNVMHLEGGHLPGKVEKLSQDDVYYRMNLLFWTIWKLCHPSFLLIKNLELPRRAGRQMPEDADQV